MEESNDSNVVGAFVTVASETVQLSYSTHCALGSEPAGPTRLWLVIQNGEHVAGKADDESMMPCAEAAELRVGLRVLTLDS